MFIICYTSLSLVFLTKKTVCHPSAYCIHKSTCIPRNVWCKLSEFYS